MEALAIAINKLINDYYRRLAERTGGARYFDREFLTQDMFNSDPQLERDLIELFKKYSQGKQVNLSK
ncbi:hypothetical protein [Methylomonas koyamae]|uniref:hypothetical protein n=1 Tax=Methylomonas koyamae TaxID=702114 RepID=UPI0006D0D7B5|nr:hypothetical protein [Methylomonas koyamae]BBL56995.1 hypothetical protein MKFW12EY_06080 [Methylomonas koyamae]